MSLTDYGTAATIFGALLAAVGMALRWLARARRRAVTAQPPVVAVEAIDNAAGVIAERNEEASREVVEALEGPSPGDAIADIINRRFH